MKKKLSIWKYGRRNIPFYMLIAVLLGLSLAMRVLAPRYLALIIDTVIGEGDTSRFAYLLSMMALAYLMPGVLGYGKEYISDIISRRTANALRQDVFESVSAEDGEFFRKRTPADLMSRTSNDTDSVGFLFGFCGIFCLEAVLICVTQMVALMGVNSRVAVIAWICTPVIGFLAVKSEFKGDKLNDSIFDKRADLNAVASEAIMGSRTVKSFGREDFEKEKFRKEAGTLKRMVLSLDSLWIHWGTPQNVIAMAMVPLALLVGGVEVMKGRMSLGDLSMAVQYIEELSWPMMELGWLLMEIAAARAGWRKVKAIMETEPVIKDGEKDDIVKEGTMVFENVTFRDGGKTLLEDFSLTIPPGRTVAIMGPSGSGKSLVTSLAVRLLDPTEGRITINGTDMHDMTLRSARGFSSIVTQDVFLFSDTVRNNIALGNRKGAKFCDIRRAADDAEATAFIERLENGWDTVIGERGVGLSGGQKQRLSLARAFMRESQLLILDDATSALDAETERDIERTISKNGKRSLLITAHRISAVASADEIIILEKGRVMERGTHNELLARKGLYWQTYISQYPEGEEA